MKILWVSLMEYLLENQGIKYFMKHAVRQAAADV